MATILMGVVPEMETKEVCIPKLFPTHTTREVLVVEKWHVREGDILQPGTLMISLETPPGFFDIPTPPFVTVPHRVVRLHVAEGEEIRLYEPFITLEPVAEGE